MSDALVYFEMHDKIAHVLLNNPPLNALTMPTREALSEVFTELEAMGNEVRAVVLSGAGEKAFAAGADIKAFLELDPPTALARLHKTHQIFGQVENFTWPVVAAVHGFCLGGGLELALCADVRYTSEEATFGFPEVNFSIFPGNGGMARGLHFLGLGRFKELVYSGRRISAADAYEYGLVEKVVPTGQVLDAAMELARDITKRGPMGVAAAKRVINQTRDLALRPAVELEAEAWSALTTTEDMMEGARAFVEKRKPVYRCR